MIVLEARYKGVMGGEERWGWLLVSVCVMFFFCCCLVMEGWGFKAGSMRRKAGGRCCFFVVRGCVCGIVYVNLYCLLLLCVGADVIECLRLSRVHVSRAK